MGQCVECPIRHRAVCSPCDPAELGVLEKIKTYRRYAPGEAIFWAGDDMPFVGTVVEGTRPSPRRWRTDGGRCWACSCLSDFIGRPDRSVAPFDVTANSAVTLCCFRRAAFRRMVEGMPRIRQRLLEMSLDDLDAARNLPEARTLIVTDPARLDAEAGDS